MICDSQMQGTAYSIGKHHGSVAELLLKSPLAPPVAEKVEIICREDI